MNVWFCIPSARPVAEANQCLRIWRERGYRVALWRDSEDGEPECDMLLVGKYPGYANAVNALAERVLVLDSECDWIVCGGDDTIPDPHDPREIARGCTAYFGGTFGVMQPTGDRFAGGSIDRIAGSPWLGREWCQRANGGRGPLWPEFTHMFVDQCLQETAIRCNAFWQRRDLIHMHRHFMRVNDRLDSPAKGKPIPDHLKQWNSPQHWSHMEAIFNRLRAQNFAPCMPTEIAANV